MCLHWCVCVFAVFLPSQASAMGGIPVNNLASVIRRGDVLAALCQEEVGDHSTTTREEFNEVCVCVCAARGEGPCVRAANGCVQAGGACDLGCTVACRAYPLSMLCSAG